MAVLVFGTGHGRNYGEYKYRMIFEIYPVKPGGGGKESLHSKYLNYLDCRLSVRNGG